jgi:thiol-disulfide isomerase/thioredoxin
MIKTSATLLLTFLFLLVQIESRAQARDKFILKGVIDTVAHSTYFVTYLDKGERVHDTISLDATSKFEYMGKISEPTIFNLAIKNTINPKLVGDRNIYSFWVEPGKTIYLKGETGWQVKGIYGLVVNPKKYELKNSETEIVESNYQRSQKEAVNTWEKNTGQSLNDAKRQLIADSIRVDFIHKHPDNYYSIYLLNRHVRIPEANYELDEKLLDKLSKTVKNTYLGKETIQCITTGKLMGKPMPDFEQTDTLSRPIKLSSFRGKYVLVDFWASWCGPCRLESPYLVKAYKQFASHGFEILGISLDNSKADWLAAIRKDQLLWTNLSDLKGFDNKVAKSFFIHAVPDNFLLDPNGIIIAKGLRGEQLLQKLDSLFNK